MKTVTKVFADALRKSERLLKPSVAYAHCDIPCGIYETDSMTTAANTVSKMVDKMAELKAPGEDPQSHREYTNNVVRIIMEKEEQAQICKEQILILWTDYFKEEHLAKYPDLHAKVWKATKLCSEAKRTVNVEVAKRLKDAVADIARIFAETKK